MRTAGFGTHNLPAGTPSVLEELGRVVRGRPGVQLYLNGGAVRDVLLGRRIRDLDLAVSRNGLEIGRELAVRLGAAFVPLHEEEGVARVVWEGRVIDLTSFRQRTTTIEADLRLRDFTVNAMAVEVPSGAALPFVGPVIDPCDGLGDLENGVLRIAGPGVFDDDPLRLLRAYRLAGALGFRIEAGTATVLRDKVALIRHPAAERIAAELDLIMEQEHASLVFRAMMDSGLLWEILPELRDGVGMPQPSSHHLDVFEHNLEALLRMEGLLNEPHRHLGGASELFLPILEHRDLWPSLKWAALFHDVGKPIKAVARDGRMTFYNHDAASCEILEAVAERWRWSVRRTRAVARLVRFHMRPFHLCNAKRKGRMSPRACLRMGKDLGDELPAVFLLAMADSLAAQGTGKPEGMEEGILELCREVRDVYRERVRPVLGLPPLLSGHDLMAAFSLSPGPMIGRILKALQQERFERPDLTRDEALAWVVERLDAFR